MGSHSGFSLSQAQTRRSQAGQKYRLKGVHRQLLLTAQETEVLTNEQQHCASGKHLAEVSRKCSSAHPPKPHYISRVGIGIQAHKSQSILLEPRLLGALRLYSSPRYPGNLPPLSGSLIRLLR